MVFLSTWLMVIPVSYHRLVGKWVVHSIDSDLEGDVSFTIDYMDEAGNEGAQVTITSDASLVVFDRTAPQLSVSIASDNPISHLSKPDDVVTLTIFSSEYLYEAPTVEIDGNTETVNPQTQDTNYTAARSMVSEDTQGELRLS